MEALIEALLEQQAYSEVQVSYSMGEAYNIAL